MLKILDLAREDPVKFDDNKVIRFEFENNEWIEIRKSRENKIQVFSKSILQVQPTASNSIVLESVKISY